MKNLRLTLFTILFLCVVHAVFAQQKVPFADEIAEFKKHDESNPPKKQGNLFIGSSSIRLWDDLEARFPGKTVVKRGVGGSELWQWTAYYTPDLIYPYEPARIFIYAGENDIAGGKSAQDVLKSFTGLYSLIREKLPVAKIYFLSIKPSPSREKYFNEMVKANALVRSFLKNKPAARYIDVSRVILGPDGKPEPSLFKEDMLHMNSLGYDRWQKVLAPLVR
ncbi:MAG: hypothetical protein INR69_00510 [Mucilaginibacter polytrichastri]|nr:hypothetical protein [Mucilaginibacter polytrichastri]